jgi:hypothetical protein
MQHQHECSTAVRNQQVAFKGIVLLHPVRRFVFEPSAIKRTSHAIYSLLFVRSIHLHQIQLVSLRIGIGVIVIIST